MVWKDDLIIEDTPTTYAGFLDKICTFEINFSSMLLFYFPLCHFKNPHEMFDLRLYLDNKHFPQHFMFANFQCLRCGLCCKNYECVEVEEEQVKKWISENREDIMKHADIIDSPNGHFHTEIVPRSWTGCPLCRKVQGKPYYSCRIHMDKDSLPVCKAYLCSKSVPVAHINYKDIDELIQIIGLNAYYSLIERDWGEEFDFSNSEVKTHRKI